MVAAKRRFFSRFPLNRKLQQWQEVLLLAPLVTGFVMTASLTGAFQIVEWSCLDLFFRIRPLEPIDSRVTVITIGESDIEQVGQWPIPDAALAKAIQNLKQHHPKVMGLDLYRDLPVQPGHQTLLNLYRTTPNLLGIEKAEGVKVKPPAELAHRGQVGIVDTVLDEDGKVRRGLLSLQHGPQSEVKLGLGVKAALIYLEKAGITLEEIDAQSGTLRLGQAIFRPFQANDGGYVRANADGYQILLNFRGPDRHFQRISFTDVLANRIPADLVRDRVILVGSIAPSINDLFRLPYYSDLTDSRQTPGVYIHATLVSQILSAALEGRPLIRVVSKPLEWLWALGWAYISAIGISLALNKRTSNHFNMLLWVVPGGGMAVLSLFGLSYLALLSGLWLPVMPPLLSLGGALVVSMLLQTQRLQNLAHIDGLTQVANRRYFDHYFQQRSLEKRPISIILCDVDYFKYYNDTYGHQAGDDCLREVAQALKQAVRSHDFVARYGGEEFAIVLPNTHLEVAVQVAERVRAKVMALELPHRRSQVSEYVTLSCGVSSANVATEVSVQALLATADEALYRAKENGRNQVASKFLPPSSLPAVLAASSIATL